MRWEGGKVGSIKADAGVALRGNNELISPQSGQAVCLPPSGIHQAPDPALLQLCSSNELKHSIKQQGRTRVRPHTGLL